MPAGREARTIFLRAPYADWSAISQGHKTEFRAQPLGAIALHAPTPVVVYALSPRRQDRSQKLMVLVEHRRARLLDLADDPAGLRREGFASYDEYRRYWRRRTGRPFRPLDEVDVFHLAPWAEGERERLGAVLIDRLYGEFMPA